MIQIEKTAVTGFDTAIHGMRNPMNSWDKSGSGFNGCMYRIGENDYNLMKSLVKAGTDHSKFMRFITVTCDIVAPMYWWKEFDTYKVGTVRNSCSTMHKLTAKPFELNDFSHEHLGSFTEMDAEANTYVYSTYNWLKMTIKQLNLLRSRYLNTKDKRYWWQMIQLLPSSYNQRSTIMLNYAVLRNMYHARKEHKLDEWREFCKWVEQLPYSELITD